MTTFPRLDLSSPSQVLRSAALLFALFVTWKIIKRFFVRGSLDNLPGPPPESFTTGSLRQMANKEAWGFHQHLADNYGGVVKIKGVFGANCLYVHDPKALNHILLKDQNIYEEAESVLQMNRLLFGEGIFTTLGERHRLQRKLLNPVFSIAHMREMVPMFYEASHRLHDTFVKIAKKPGDQEIDIIEWMTRLALELIGQSGLGVTFDPLAEGTEPHAYGQASKMLLPLASEQTSPLLGLIMPLITKFTNWPRLGRFIVDLIPGKGINDIKYIVDTLHKTSVEIIENKKKALAAGDDALKDQIGKGKDVISILMRANLFVPKEEQMSEREVLGQITSLTFAATDTTSTAISRTLHVLSQHKDAQDQLRLELREARKENGGEDLPYDTLVHLPYLDAVCRETLRLYPPAGVLHRTAREDVTLPLGTPIKGIDGTDITSLEVPKGTDVYISALGSNRNPELWGPDAHIWKPERWLNPLPESLINSRIPGIYSHLMTFLGGGRACVGFKFSQLEMKAVLSLIVEDLEFSLPAGKEIYWQFNPVASPNTDPKGQMPTMPLKVKYVGTK
ncbi:unnamed protein product [Cyclocybe aegerita]|uniref:Cytochrome P450 n=1 Tax=Cyclocybe aegerita TaxID=1973307 RepID=A0A8S0WQH7_CYCAE|nr:unnamed protein product [Cyclocybe aegerita]